MGLPWYKWFVQDWLTSSTRLRLSLLERGLYRELLDWHYAEGSIPADEKVLARMVVASQEEFSSAWPAVSKFFAPDSKDPDKLVNNRAADVLREQRKWQKNQQVNGSKGGRPRKADGIANQNPDETQRKPMGFENETQKKARARASESESEQIIPPTPLIEDDGGWAPLFERWWHVYPRKIAKADARKAYSEIVVRGKVKPEHRADLKPLPHFADRSEQLMEATKRWAGEFATRDGDKVPYPATFLRRMDWLAVPEAAAPAKKKFLRSWES